MNVEGPLVKARPQAVRNRPTPHSAPYKAVPECVRNRDPTTTRRNAVARKANVAWPTIGSAT